MTRDVKEKTSNLFANIVRLLSVCVTVRDGVSDSRHFQKKKENNTLLILLVFWSHKRHMNQQIVTATPKPHS